MYELIAWIQCKSYSYHDILELHMSGWWELAFLLRNIDAKVSLENKMWDWGRIKVFCTTRQEAIAPRADLRFPIKARQLFHDIPLGNSYSDTGLMKPFPYQVVFFQNKKKLSDERPGQQFELGHTHFMKHNLLRAAIFG